MTENESTPAGETKPEVKADAKNRGLRSLGQAVVASVLAFAGALGADMAVPGFEFSPELAGYGLAVAVLTPVLAYAQRRAGK